MQGSLQGVTVCYVSTEAFGGLWRTWKQARTLRDAGARIVIVGYQDLVPPKLREAPLETVLVRSPHRDFADPAWLLWAALNRLPGRHQKQVPARVHGRVHLRRRHAPIVDAVASTGADIVQAVDLTALECAHEAARRIGAKLVYASHELWDGFVQNPDAAIDPVLAATLLEVERDLISDASMVLATSDAMGQRLSEMYGIPRPLTILNAPPQRVEVPRPVSWPVRFVFHGGLSRDRNVDGLIRAMEALRGQATLDVYGYGRTTDAGVLQDLIDALDLGGSVTLHGRFAYEGVVELLSSYDVGVMANRILEENFEVTLPNKVFDCMCAGLAIAMTGSTAVRATLDEVPFGITVDPSSPETIARDLGALLQDPNRIMAMKRAAVAAAPRYWWPEQGRRLLEGMCELLRDDQ
jgi:glycosyltransferase involved in cell wall biosynthesis